MIRIISQFLLLILLFGAGRVDAAKPYPTTEVMIRDVKNHLRAVSRGLPTFYPATSVPFRWLQKTNFNDPTNLSKLQRMWSEVKKRSLDLPGLSQEMAAHDKQNIHANERSWLSSLFDSLSSAVSPAQSHPSGVRLITSGGQGVYGDGGRTGYASTQPTFFAPSGRTESSRAPGVTGSVNSYQGQISDITGRPKTRWVDSYKKDDGTVVQGYWTSR